jgi:bifunctional non-homologous end joining protein LigD
VVFDLDPPDAVRSFDPVRRGALILRRLLESELGLTAFVKTTGGHGLHVHLPLDGRTGFDGAREFARAVGDLIAARHQDTFTTSQRISGRQGRIYVDVMRNAFAQTVVAPYGIRGRPGAQVATPVTWAEVEDESLTPGRFTLRDMPARLAEVSAGENPWEGFWRRRYGIPAAQRKLAGLR